MKKIGIYKITSPTNKIYIGQSVDINHRFVMYRALNCKKQLHLHASFLKHGVENHKFEIIQLCEKDKLNDLEIYYINFYDCFNTPLGLNLKSGGSYNSLTDEIKKKISDKLKGRFISDETRKKLSIAHTNPSDEIRKRMSNTSKNISLETRNKMSNAHKGNKYHLGHRASDEVRLKMSISQKGKKLSEKSKINIGNAHKKYVLDTQMGIFYLGVSEAAKAYCINTSTLYNKLTGQSKNNTNFIYV